LFRRKFKKKATKWGGNDNGEVGLESVSLENILKQINIESEVVRRPVVEYFFRNHGDTYNTLLNAGMVPSLEYTHNEKNIAGKCTEGKYDEDNPFFKKYTIDARK